MAILHRAQLNPSKLQLLNPWLVQQEWAQPTTAEWERVATYRFDDPDGEVGVETFILTNGDQTQLHVPLTYRGAPLPSAEEHLIGTTEHTVLGPRWVYDATGDPVYAQTLATTILSGATEAEQYFETDGRREPVPNTAHVRGTGNSPDTQPLPKSVNSSTTDGTTTITTETHTLVVLRRISEHLPDGLHHTLHGTWATHQEPTPLAGIRAH